MKHKVKTNANPNTVAGGAGAQATPIVLRLGIPSQGILHLHRTSRRFYHKGIDEQGKSYDHLLQ